MNGYAGRSQLKNLKPESSTLKGYAQNSKRACADLAVGMAVFTALISQLAFRYNMCSKNNLKSHHKKWWFDDGTQMLPYAQSRDKVYWNQLAGCQGSPTFLPTGPCMLPTAFVPDPQQFHLTFKLNGDMMQEEGATDMIFGVTRLIEYISSLVELWPGDLICTGSPHGNGMHYKSFLQSGGTMEGTITGLGTQRTPVLRKRCRDAMMDIDTLLWTFRCGF